MARNEAKAKSARRALRDLPNNNNNNTHTNSSNDCGRFSKSIKTTKKRISEKEIEKQQTASTIQRQHQEAKEEEEDCLDLLLLVQSDLSSLTRQIDEIVAQAFEVKTTSKQGRREIESFSHVLSDMISSLKPWVPRFQKALSRSPSAEFGVKCLANKTVSAVNDDDKFEVESPKQTGRNSLISPSPLVSWRAADANIDRGRHLFLLTPLPMSKTLSSKRMDLSKSLFEGFTPNHPVVEVPSFLTFSQHENDDWLQGTATKPTPEKPSDSVVTEAKTIVDSQCVSSPIFSKTDHSVLVMTPYLKMSPPKSCVLLEPFSESTHKGRFMVRKSTPFPVGMLAHISESSSDSEASSEDLASKYPELLGIQRACDKPNVGKKEFETSPGWLFSPPKTCVLLEPPDEKSPDTIAVDHRLSITAPDSNQQIKLSLFKEDNDQPCNKVSAEPRVNSLTLAESTPMWKEPESTMTKGKRPGENTLKKELWTKFEAASSYGLRLDVSSLQRTAQKGFLDMLDEVSCDGECPVDI
ncbi:uncharacterized protein LOC8273777 [Ricinus communis]|uniref:Uncharacterized protein n=1 Tax=Ricinus communis TaxID=3988 RepID=B9RQE3_RICCO|nr:uncharacterized protein LOC8273777 [Ricinus communis]EEF46382.1 conserved hypothetical protein [Ricinus communis]|eukprot:XP_002515962.1 uncharacterized protein LOC8273777 [Ricinus communis]